MEDLSEAVVSQITGDFATRDELADETAARIAGDDAATAGLSTETTARIAGDDALQAAIAAITIEALGISFDDILGQIADDQVPDSFTRDVEVNDLVTSISGNVIQSGTVSETRIDSAIARDTEVNAAISALSTTVNNSINAINYSQVQGTVDESDIDSDIARDTEVTTALAAYLPLAGGSMTGNIAMASGRTVDGVDVSVLNSDYQGKIANHENRITILESTNEQIASSQLAQAHGSIASNGSVLSGYHVSNVSYNSSNSHYTVTLSDPLPSTYSVMVTATTDAGTMAQVLNKTTTSFTVSFVTLLLGRSTVDFTPAETGFDFVVFSN